MSQLDRSYEPTELEARWYQRWLDAGCFRADQTSPREPFVIVIPPPNVTGSLHMGHALTNTIQDILTRHHRMAGYNALWLPGTDHAGIATQMVVERQLRREGLDRRTMGRDAFVARVWQWKEKYGDRINLQLRRLGSSLDWSRERFTMDDGLSRAVREVFVRLWEEGLIYQDQRLVNWDPEGQTVLSDLEVEQEEEDGFLWHIAYPVEGSDDRLVVATTRPETLLGDTAVAIHPDDPRYAHLHGRRVLLPLTGRTIPILCDPLAARMEFGSGAVKITPGHDFNDFETGRRNQLPTITVLDLQARINDQAPEPYRGLTREEARTRVLADLREAGLLVKEEPYRFAPGRSQRTGVIVEPLSIGRQWFVRMAPLAAPAIDAVRSGRIHFIPDAWEKTYFHWMENVRDWCISRQLWWGHRIPAWTCSDCGRVSVSRTDLTACPACDSVSLQQDEDVLDTWFSSALWPFSTLGWPDDTADLRAFYPTTVMETGFDIIFFWVARMIFMGLHFMEEVPFRTVFLHAMVRDKHGRKMSKSYGNVIDPLHVIDGVRPAELSEEEREHYAMLFRDFPDGIPAQGADALRLTLAVYAAAGRDIRLDVKRVEGYKAFVNKLWNASRFALMNLSDWAPVDFGAAAGAPPLRDGGPRFEGDGVPLPFSFASDARLSPADRWILTRLRAVTASVHAALREFRFNDAAQSLYEFVWHELCDWYLELAKPVFQALSDFPGERATTQTVLAFVLDRTLRLLHPIIPFVTEEIWSALPRVQDPAEPVLCVARWPDASRIPEWPDAARVMNAATAVITGIRRLRAESSVPPSRALGTVLLLSEDAGLRDELEKVAGYIRRLARVTEVVTLAPDAARPARCATTTEAGVEICISLDGLVDFDAERSRIAKELERVERDVAFFEKKLGNPRFVQGAPADVVAKDREKLEEARAARDALLRARERLA